MDQQIEAAIRSTFGIDIKNSEPQGSCAVVHTNSFLVVEKPSDDKSLPEEEIVSFLSAYGIKAKVIDTNELRKSF